MIETFMSSSKDFGDEPSILGMNLQKQPWNFLETQKTETMLLFKQKVNFSNIIFVCPIGCGPLPVTVVNEG